MNENTRINEGPAEGPVNWGQVSCSKSIHMETITKGQCLFRQEEWPEEGEVNCRGCEMWLGGDQ